MHAVAGWRKIVERTSGAEPDACPTGCRQWYRPHGSAAWHLPAATCLRAWHRPPYSMPGQRAATAGCCISDGADGFETAREAPDDGVLPTRCSAAFL